MIAQPVGAMDKAPTIFRLSFLSIEHFFLFISVAENSVAV